MDLTTFQDEWFECPDCKSPVYVIWDPLQKEREVACTSCAHTRTEEHIQTDDKGKPVMSLRRKGPDGQPLPVTYNSHHKGGCHFPAKRGDGLDYEAAVAKWEAPKYLPKNTVIRREAPRG